MSTKHVNRMLLGQRRFIRAESAKLLKYILMKTTAEEWQLSVPC